MSDSTSPQATRSAAALLVDCLAAEGARLLEERKIGSGLIVVDDERRVVGALNIHDLLRARVV